MHRLLLAAVLVACPSPPTLATDGEPIGPGGGGRMSRVVFSPHASGLIWAANDMGGIFVSRDGGESFAYRSHTLHGGSVVDLALHPNDPDTLLALTRTHGVYVSSDAGATWTPLPGNANLDLAPYDGTFVPQDHRVAFQALAVDPTDDSRLLVALQRNRALFESLDGGSTFRRLLTVWWPPEEVAPAETSPGYPFSNDQRAFMPCSFGRCGPPTIDVAIDPNDPAVALAAADMGLERFDIDTVDGLVSRRLLHNGLLTVTGWGQGITVASSHDGRRIYAVGMDTTVWRSTDGGDSWESLVSEELMISDGERGWFHATSVAVVEGEPDTVFVSAAHTLGGGAVFRSTDGGDSWRRLRVGLPYVVADGGVDGVCDQVLVTPDFAATRTVYALFNGYGVYRSCDGGDSWISVSDGLPTTGIRFGPGLAVDPAEPATLYLTTFGPGYSIWISHDRGDSWRRNVVPEPLGGAATGGPTAVATDDGTVLLVSGHRGIVRSSDGGATWEPSFSIAEMVGDRRDEHWTWQIPLSKVVAHPQERGRLFFVTSNWGGHQRVPLHGIYESLDAGSTWHKLFDLPNFGGSINTSDDGRWILQFSGGMDIWRYRIPQRPRHSEGRASR